MDKQKMIGMVTIVKNGIIVKKLHNTIVTTGKGSMSGLLLSDIGGTAFDYIAIGTGTTGVVAGDTTLETESMRVAGTGTQTTTTTTNDTAHLESTFSIVSTLAITESGMLNASSSGTLLNRTTFSAINVENGDELVIKWDIQFT